MLNVLSFVIERLDSGIRPHCGELIAYLPALWHDSAAHNMLRVVILSTLIHLVQVRFYSDPPGTGEIPLWFTWYR